MHDVKTMARYAKAAGFIATLLTVGITARFGWMQGEDLVTSVCYAGGLALASFLVGYGLVFAWAAYKRNMPKVIVGSAIVVFLIAVAVELLSHLGATASARNHDMAKAQEQTTKTSDVRAELERKRADLAAMKPTRSPAAISADMANIESRPWFASVANCSNPNSYGSYGNSCRRYNAMKGELATAQTRAALDRDVAALTAKAADSHSGHSIAAAQSGALAQYAMMTLRPTADDQAKTNMAIQLLLALYFVAIGLVNLIGHALDEHDTPAPARTADVVPLRPANDPVVARETIVQPHDNTEVWRAINNALNTRKAA